MMRHRVRREEAAVPAYVVVTQLTPAGAEALTKDPGRIAAINAEVERLGARITQQYSVVGPYDFVTFVEAPDNETALTIAIEISSLGTVKLQVYPVIAFSRFTKLLRDEEPYRTEPHRWQTQLWARVARRTGRHWVMTRHMRRLCRPMVVEGLENLEGVRGPVLYIANHTSHIDTPVLVSSLPAALRERTAVAAAADRFYRVSQRSWWFSLFWNTYPIARGGGMKALDYSKELLQSGWSILIFPEGGRFKAGAVQRFHHGPTILAMQAKVPVVPAYLEGLHLLMPKGQRTTSPGPALVRFGPPVSLDDLTDVPAGTERLRAAVMDLAGMSRMASAEAAG
jgi:1-acyl-sn-glycerol-3-phosphate acyltransferase